MLRFDATSTRPRSHPRSGSPTSVYRLQLNRHFTFSAALPVLAYLKELGVDAAYCSSYLQAVEGSLHGYDVTDPGRINREIGSEADYEAFCATLQRLGLAQVLDVVPNHMGISSAGNAWWMDVLENGRASIYTDFFDVDWEPVKDEIHGKILFAILGDYYGTVLENGEIQVAYDDGRFTLRYGSHVLPVAPDTYPLLLPESADDVAAAFRALPPRSESSAERRSERHGLKQEAQRRLAARVRESDDLRRGIEHRLRAVNGRKGDPQSFDELDRLLNEQSYRLAYWRVASEEINYRRFFDIKELAALRMQDRRVFDAYHALIFRLVGEGKIQGLRIDHPDGLYDPPAYFAALQDAYRSVSRAPAEGESQDTPLYVVVEKILEADEKLPDDWPVHGTVGYEFMASLNGLFVKTENRRAMTQVYQAFVGRGTDFEELLYRAKLFICAVRVPSEIAAMGHRLDRLSEQNRRFRDFTLNNLTHALRETIACFPVYRTYLSPRTEKASERDARYIRLAIARARSRAPYVHGAVFDFLERVLLLQFDDTMGAEERRMYVDFALRFQQLTGPVMAKGFEDTTLYIYNRLLSLNEVGSDPHRFGTTPRQFHQANRERLERWPLSFLATSTHDHKRSEDVRCRISVLSEIPAEWKIRVARWSAMNLPHKTTIAGRLEPDANTEYFIYQTLIGAWPDEPLNEQTGPAWRERIRTYLEKSVREANVKTAWVAPNEAYEAAVHGFVDRLLAPDPHPFLDDFLPFQQRIAACGRWNSLSALALKIGSPGVVDTYQGCELWNYTLVDPDNRQPVDYEERARALQQVKSATDVSALIGAPGGLLKLYLVWKGLTFRREHPELFLDGAYIPLWAEGERRGNVVAFARKTRREVMVVLAARFFASLLEGGRAAPTGPEAWGDTTVRLPRQVKARGWVDLLTGRTFPKVTSLALRDVFHTLGTAVLVGKEHAS